MCTNPIHALGRVYKMGRRCTKWEDAVQNGKTLYKVGRRCTKSVHHSRNCKPTFTWLSLVNFFKSMWWYCMWGFTFRYAFAASSTSAGIVWFFTSPRWKTSVDSNSVRHSGGDSSAGRVFFGSLFLGAGTGRGFGCGASDILVCSRGRRYLCEVADKG